MSNNYLVPGLQQQMLHNNSALGWTPGPNGNWVPVALGTEYLPPQSQPQSLPLGQTATTQAAATGGGLSGLSWLLIGAAAVYFRKPIMGFFATAEQAAEQAVGKMRKKVESRSSGTALTKRVEEARRKRSRSRRRR